MQRIGITGRMAAGKSTLGRWLRGRGFLLLDTDEVVARLYETGEVKDILQSKFGWQLFTPDGQVNQNLIAECAWDNDYFRHTLETILRPRVREMVEMWFFGAQKNAYQTVFVLALPLFAAETRDLCDECWLVSAPDELLLERLQARERIDRQDAERRLACTPPDDDKEMLCREVLVNDGSLDQFFDELEEVLIRRRFHP